MSSKRSKTDLLVRQRFLNPLPPPAFPPKLLTIKTDPSRYTSYDFLVPLSMERMVPMIVDGEGGMHLDQNAVPGYWETKQGRTGKMVPDMELEAPEMDEEDLELLAEPSMNLPGATNTVNAGLMPANSGANLDLVGSGVHAASSPATALEKRKKDVAFVHKTVMKSTGDSGVSARQEALAAAQQAHVKTEATLAEQIEAITSTFSALDIPISELRHPTKPHLDAVESFDIFPDEFIAANQYMLFKFAENPNERKAGSSSQLVEPSAGAASLGLFRPIETELDDSGASRVGFFLPEDDEIAESYNRARRDGKYVDSEILSGVSRELDEEEENAEQQQYGFRFMRDYDATRRETRAEFVFSIQEEDDLDSPEGNAKAKGAYYTPLSGHSLLRKRRARKGEAINDYTDLGVDFWGGVLVSLGGKEAMTDEGEIEGRLEELQSLLVPPTEDNGSAPEPKEEDGKPLDTAMTDVNGQNGVH